MAQDILGDNWDQITVLYLLYLDCILPQNKCFLNIFVCKSACLLIYL